MNTLTIKQQLQIDIIDCERELEQLEQNLKIAWYNVCLSNADQQNIQRWQTYIDEETCRLEGKSELIKKMINNKITNYNKELEKCKANHFDSNDLQNKFDSLNTKKSIFTEKLRNLKIELIKNS